MMTPLEIMIILGDLQDPQPREEDALEVVPGGDGSSPSDWEVDRDSYSDAMAEWEFRAERRRKNLTHFAEADALPDNIEDTFRKELSRAASRVDKAENTRTQMMALAAHSSRLSLRSIADAAGLNYRTAEKRINHPDGLEFVIAFKERELEALRNRAEREKEKDSE